MAEHQGILVAEDHPVNRRVMGLLLEYIGVNCTMVENGRQAVEASQETDFELILMDIMMPEMDGFEAAYEIRKREFDKQSHTPIIACSALDRDKAREQCIRSGIDDFVAKPISKQELENKIEHWCNIRVCRRMATPEIQAQIDRMEADEKAQAINGMSLRLMYGLAQLDDILALFLAVTETLLAQLDSAIQHEDLAVVRRMAHEIKGSSYAISAKEMAELCLQLEIAGEQKNWPQVTRIYAALGLAFARVREFVLNKKNILEDLRRAS